MISRRTLLVAVAALIPSFAAQASSADYARMSDAELIDSLREIDKQTIGLHATLLISAFLADDAPAQVVGGVFGSSAPAEFPQMRELVRRGAKSLPELLRHIDDARPTKLAIGPNIFPIQWGMFRDEYDPRQREKRDDAGRAKEFRIEDRADLPYTVTVGDVCFVLVGQITNRNLTAVCYQPSGGVLIVSSVRDKALAERVRRDWQGVTAEELKASLIRDAVDFPSADSALVRLRVFYPDEYRKQRAGELKGQIEAFEAKAKKG